MPNVYKKKAFTLIEILVVIGIIALLAAILFPVLSRARERARATTCMNNQHQIALAIIQYTQDYGRRFPINPVCGDLNKCDGWAINIGLTDGLNGVIFQCPSEVEDDNVDAFSDYFLNSELMGESDVRVRYPANTILIGDGPYASSESNLGPSSTPPWNAGSPYTERHFDGANYAFADGHVKWLKASAITVDDAAAGDNFAFRVQPATP